jgi:hypothetical protein
MSYPCMSCKELRVTSIAPQDSLRNVLILGKCFDYLANYGL